MFSCKLCDTQQWHKSEHRPLGELTTSVSNKLFF